MSDQIGIEIRNLFKIYGPLGQEFVDAVANGMTKYELNERHQLVLGLNNINLTMEAGKIHVIMGLSGSGKSTLIRHINRLIDPTHGEILVGGEDVVKMSPMELREFRRRKTAMVFQKFALLPHRTILENASFGLEVQGLDGRKRTDIAMQWIERVGLAGYEKKYPSQLSGGMQQRVGLARALSNDAPILLMDEAYSALDPLIRYDMQTVLLDLQKDVKKTVVFITHDLDEALMLGDQIAILRDGSIVQAGTAQDIVLRPADDYVRNFVQHVDRGHVIHVGSIMRDYTGDEELPPKAVDKGMTIQKAVQKMLTEADQSLSVVDQNQTPVGIVTLKDAMVAYAG